MGSITIGLLFGGLLCAIGVIFERWSRALKGVGALTIGQASIMIRMMLGISVTIGLIHFEIVDRAYYLATFGFMVCIIYPISIYISQINRISVYKALSLHHNKNTDNEK